jgi:hypothetical protein
MIVRVLFYPANKNLLRFAKGKQTENDFGYFEENT